MSRSLGERDRDTEREKEKDRERQTGRQTGGQTDRPKDIVDVEHVEQVE